MRILLVKGSGIKTNEYAESEDYIVCKSESIEATVGGEGRERRFLIEGGLLGFIQT